MDLKTEKNGLYRAPSGALISKDFRGLASYRSQKAKLRRVEEIESDLRDLKSDIGEIKDLLKGFLSK